MSVEYDKYIERHRASVVLAFLWLREYWGEVKLILPFVDQDECYDMVRHHDASKDMDELEYKAYDDFFYGERTPEVRMAFDYAWLSHIHQNPHHWQHWLLHKDDGTARPLEMTDAYILEMICDWWSFSWNKHMYEDSNLDSLYGIFDWYDAHKDRMVLAPMTRDRVEKLLNLIRRNL